MENTSLAERLRKCAELVGSGNEQVQSGKQGAALATFVRHLLTLVALPLSREEQELICVFRNATEAQRFLIARHVSIGVTPTEAPQNAKLA